MLGPNDFCGCFAWSPKVSCWTAHCDDVGSQATKVTVLHCKVDKSMYREKIDSIVSILIAWTEARMHEFQENWDEIYESEEFGF